MKAEGDCYLTAWMYMIDHGAKGGLSLVHGVPTGQGPIAGVQYGHAWIERGSDDYDPANLVIDVANGANLRIPAALYYRIGRIDPSRRYRRYSYDEARRLGLETGTPGPWTDDVYPEIPGLEGEDDE